MTVLLSKISCYLWKGVCCILLAFQHGSALAQRPPLQSADSSTGQHWNKSCLLHRWGAVGCSLVATALILKNWNTALLKSKDWVLKHDLRGEREIELIYFLAAKQTQLRSCREIKQPPTTEVRGDRELNIYRSFTGITAILWLDCATQQLQHKRR